MTSYVITEPGGKYEVIRLQAALKLSEHRRKRMETEYQRNIESLGAKLVDFEKTLQKEKQDIVALLLNKESELECAKNTIKMLRAKLESPPCDVSGNLQEDVATSDSNEMPQMSLPEPLVLELVSSRGGATKRRLPKKAKLSPVAEESEVTFASSLRNVHADTNPERFHAMLHASLNRLQQGTTTRKKNVSPEDTNSNNTLVASVDESSLTESLEDHTLVESFENTSDKLVSNVNGEKEESDEPTEKYDNSVTHIFESDTSSKLEINNSESLVESIVNYTDKLVSKTLGLATKEFSSRKTKQLSNVDEFSRDIVDYCLIDARLALSEEFRRNSQPNVSMNAEHGQINGKREGGPICPKIEIGDELAKQMNGEITGNKIANNDNVVEMHAIETEDDQFVESCIDPIDTLARDQVKIILRKVINEIDVESNSLETNPQESESSSLIIQPTNIENIPKIVINRTNSDIEKLKIENMKIDEEDISSIENINVESTSDHALVLDKKPEDLPTLENQGADGEKQSETLPVENTIAKGEVDAKITPNNSEQNNLNGVAETSANATVTPANIELAENVENHIESLKNHDEFENKHENHVENRDNNVENFDNNVENHEGDETPSLFETSGEELSISSLAECKTSPHKHSLFDILDDDVVLDGQTSGTRDGSRRGSAKDELFVNIDMNENSDSDYTVLELLEDNSDKPTRKSSGGSPARKSSGGSPARKSSGGSDSYSKKIVDGFVRNVISGAVTDVLRDRSLKNIIHSAAETSSGGENNAKKPKRKKRKKKKKKDSTSQFFVDPPAIKVVEAEVNADKFSMLVDETLDAVSDC